MDFKVFLHQCSPYCPPITREVTCWKENWGGGLDIYVGDAVFKNVPHKSKQNSSSIYWEGCLVRDRFDEDSCYSETMEQTTVTEGCTRKTLKCIRTELNNNGLCDEAKPTFEHTLEWGGDYMAFCSDTPLKVGREYTIWVCTKELD